MRIFILDKEKVTKFNLPSKVSGAFAIDYLPVGSKIKRTVSIEAFENQWIVKSNGSVDVLNGNVVLDNAILNEYSCQQITVKGRNDFIVIYSLPSIDDKFSRYAITKGPISIGTDNSCAIVYNNSLVLPQHIAIGQKEDGWYIQVAQDDNRFVYLNGKRVINKKLKIGDVIFLYGLKIIWMGTFVQMNQPSEQLFVNSFALVNYTEQVITNNTEIDPVSDEEMAIELYNENDYFFHTPRLKQSLTMEQIRIDAPPKSPLQEELPFLLTLGSSITMLSSSLMTGYTAISGITSGQRTWGQALPSLVTCGALVIGSLIMPRIIQAYQKNSRKKKEKLRQEKYTAYIKKKEEEINIKLLDQAQILRNNYISINECYNLVFSARKTALWNHEIRDEDFLSIKLGTGNCPAKIQIEAPQEHFTLEEDNLEQLVIDVVSKLHTLDNVPITFSFVEKHISAFICNSSFNTDFMNGVFLQLMALHSSQDLKLVFLLSGNTESYEFAKFSPHCLSADKSIRFFAENLEDIKHISSYLETEMTKRKRELYGKESNDSSDSNLGKELDKNDTYKNFEPYYLVITNNYTLIKNVPIIKDIVETTNNLGFALTIIDSSLQSLPNECAAFIELLDKESCIIEKDLNNQSRFTAEIVQGMDMRAVANKLSNIPIAYLDEESALPSMMTFLEMYNVARIEQLNILNKWKTNDPTTSLKAPIGVHTSGDLFELDLHEKFHGPHGLIAGSTGSGKSEFIITYILSMCVNYHPDEVQFVLIDYKGGGLAGAFENRETGLRVPHLVGTITNLDTSEMNRTLVSINSELKRRQKIFNDAKGPTGESTIDIYKYQHYYREGVLDKPVSHLFIISDEFAELKSQQPEFMNELISAARIGRSLGVHLILATQKPSGVVNDQIWSNTKFRVCLKVQDRGDSMEVLKKPDAASLKDTGRFYLQVGYDEYFDIGQSGWAGAKYIPSDAVIRKVDDSIKFVDDVGKVVKTVTEIVKQKDDGVKRGDQLTNIVKYLTSIAEEENYVPQQMWLDKIPAEIFLGNLIQKYNFSARPYEIEAIIGEYDNPSQQMQGLFTLNLMESNTLIYGMPDSGKENLLATLIYSVITTHTPEEINFYVLDLGAETLKVFAKAPHVGEVCTIEDQEKILNMLIMIDKELDRRKELFVDYGGSYTNYCQNSGEKLPLINVIINGYEIFAENMSRISELLTTMYRDALKYGISFVIVTGAANSFRARVAEYFSTKLCLQMANDTDYRNLLMCERGLIPAKISGRGISGIEGLKYEFQTAYINKSDALNSTIKETIATLIETCKSTAPRVPVLPDVVTVEHVLPDLKNLDAVPIGVDIDSKQTATYDFTKNRVTPIVYSAIDDAIGFFYSTFTMLKTLPNLRIRVLDANKEFDIAKMPVEYHFENFRAVIPALIQEIKVTANTEVNNIYFINGISQLKGKLDEATQQYIEDLLKFAKESNNTIVVISDNYNNYKAVQLESWYKDIVSSANGIWIGAGIGTQLVFDTAKVSPEAKNSNYPDMAFVIQKGKYTAIKKVTVKQEEDSNEE